MAEKGIFLAGTDTPFTKYRGSEAAFNADFHGAKSIKVLEANCSNFLVKLRIFTVKY